MYFEIEDNRFIYKAEKKRKGLYAHPHLHDQIELILLCEGQTLAYVDRKEYLLKGGDMFVVFPNRVHYYNRCAGSNDLVLVSPDVCPEFLQYFNDFSPVEPIIHGALDNAVIRGMIDNLTRNRQDVFSEVEMRGYLLILLSEVLRCIELTPVSGCDNSRAKDVILYCYNNFTDNIMLSSVADALHLSRYYVSHLFSELGVGFNEYINSLRIAKACEKLKNTKMSVSEIAYEVGFGSIRTFNRAFLKVNGITPRRYRDA